MKKNKLPELTLKYSKGKFKEVKITSSKNVIEQSRRLFDEDTIEYREEMLIILLNRNNVILGWSSVSKGGVTGTVVDVKVIMSIALLSGASGIILSHNHPSGNTKPSQADISITNKINDACKIMDISLIDHVIQTKDDYYSFIDEGILN